MALSVMTINIADGADPRLLSDVAPGWKARDDDPAAASRKSLHRLVLCSHELEHWKALKESHGAAQLAAGASAVRELDIKRSDFTERLTQDVERAERRARETLKSRTRTLLKMAMSKSVLGASEDQLVAMEARKERRVSVPATAVAAGAAAGAPPPSPGLSEAAQRRGSQASATSRGERPPSGSAASSAAPSAPGSAPGTAPSTAEGGPRGAKPARPRLTLSATTRHELGMTRSSKAMEGELRELDRQRIECLRKLNRRGVFSEEVNAVRARAMYRVALRNKLRVRNTDPRREPTPAARAAAAPTREESLESRMLWLIDFIDEYDHFDALNETSQRAELAAALVPKMYAPALGNAAPAAALGGPGGRPDEDAEARRAAEAMQAAAGAVLRYRVRIDDIRQQRVEHAASELDAPPETSPRPLGSFEDIHDLAEAALTAAREAEGHLNRLTDGRATLARSVSGASSARSGRGGGDGGGGRRRRPSGALQLPEDREDGEDSAPTTSRSRRGAPAAPQPLPAPAAESSRPMLPMMLRSRSVKPATPVTAAQQALGAPGRASGRRGSADSLSLTSGPSSQTLPEAESSAATALSEGGPAAAPMPVFSVDDSPLTHFPILDAAAQRLPAAPISTDSWTEADLLEDAALSELGPRPELPPLMAVLGAPPTEQLQRRLERVWALLRLPVPAQLAMVIKYTSRDYSGMLELALEAWELAAAAVLQRECALAEIELRERARAAASADAAAAAAGAASGNVVFVPRRAAPAAGGGAAAVAAARWLDPALNPEELEALLSEAERLTLHVLRWDAVLHARFGDVLTFEGRPYVAGGGGPEDEASQESYWGGGGEGSPGGGPPARTSAETSRAGAYGNGLYGLHELAEEEEGAEALN